MLHVQPGMAVGNLELARRLNERSFLIDRFEKLDLSGPMREPFGKTTWIFILGLEVPFEPSSLRMRARL